LPHTAYTIVVDHRQLSKTIHLFDKLVSSDKNRASDILITKIRST
jgi:hypothetical protein